MKGVNWNPVRRGGRHPEDVDFRGFVETDAEIMALAGINVVRTYEAITDLVVLDALWSRNIFVLNSVYMNAEQPVDTIAAKVRAVMWHPAILMWVVGNEWNYNGFYMHLNLDAATSLLKDAAREVRSVDSTRPIATVFGSLPEGKMVELLDDDIDIWGINQYEKLSFGPLFDNWAKLPTSKPMFLSEYGADAFNSLKGKPDELAQAVATKSLTKEIIDATSQRPDGVCVGGLIFEFADEWWKSGQLDVHDAVGNRDNAFGNVYPDRTFNEEWFGLVHSDGTQRPAFRAYAEISAPGCAAGSLLPGCGRVPSRASSGERLRACGAFKACAGHLGYCSVDTQGICMPLAKVTTAMTTTTMVSSGWAAMEKNHGSLGVSYPHSEASAAEWHGLLFFFRKFETNKLKHWIPQLRGRLQAGSAVNLLIGLTLSVIACAIAAWRLTPRFYVAALDWPRDDYLVTERQVHVAAGCHDSFQGLLGQWGQEP